MIVSYISGVKFSGDINGKTPDDLRECLRIIRKNNRNVQSVTIGKDGIKVYSGKDK